MLLNCKIVELLLNLTIVDILIGKKKELLQESNVGYVDKPTLGEP